MNVQKDPRNEKTLPFLAGDSILLNINVSPRLAKEAAWSQDKTNTNSWS